MHRYTKEQRKNAEYLCQFSFPSTITTLSLPATSLLSWFFNTYGESDLCPCSTRWVCMRPMLVFSITIYQETLIMEAVRSTLRNNWIPKIYLHFHLGNDIIIFLWLSGSISQANPFSSCFVMIIWTPKWSHDYTAANFNITIVLHPRTIMSLLGAETSK